MPTLLAGAALLVVLSLGVPAPQASAQTSGSGTGGLTASAPDRESAEAGRRLYGQHCSHCHGINMVNPGTVSYDLRKFPAEDPDRFFRSVLEGKNTMPAWKASLTEEQVSKLWAYVRTRGKAS